MTAPTDPIESLRRTLIERRTALGYGQRKVGERMGTAQSNVSALETGMTASPGIDVLIRWAEALHVKLTIRIELEEIVVPSRTVTLPLTSAAEGPPYSEEEYAELAQRYRETGGRVPSPEERAADGH